MCNAGNVPVLYRFDHLNYFQQHFANLCNCWRRWRGSERCPSIFWYVFWTQIIILMLLALLQIYCCSIVVLQILLFKKLNRQRLN